MPQLFVQSAYTNQETGSFIIFVLSRCDSTIWSGVKNCTASERILLNYNSIEVLSIYLLKNNNDIFVWYRHTVGRHQWKCNHELYIMFPRHVSFVNLIITIRWNTYISYISPTFWNGWLIKWWCSQLRSLAASMIYVENVDVFINCNSSNA